MGRITFIIGGARSGKSAYALSLARKCGGGVVFVATAEGKDAAMRRRISRHRKERPVHWNTIEEPCEVARALSRVSRAASCVIIDCLTFLVSNLMLSGRGSRMIEKEVKNILSALKKMDARGIIVSNEVGMGIVPGNERARRFRDIAGVINQVTAAQAHEVIFMASGIPWMIKKGDGNELKEEN